MATEDGRGPDAGHKAKKAGAEKADDEANDEMISGKSLAAIAGDNDTPQRFLGRQR